MKKLAIALFVALLGLAFVAPSFALENQFGGYFRVRMFNNTDFDGLDNVDGSIPTTGAFPEPVWNGTAGAFDYDPNTAGVQAAGAIARTAKYKDIQRADTRTRLYYTAVINDNLKFVSKFEMDAVWGDSSSYGDIGADGVNVEVKNTYIDFNLGAANVKLGTHGGSIHRGFVFADDFSGITLSSGGFAAVYMKVTESGDAVTDDVQGYHLRYAIGMGDLTVTPNFTYVDQAADDNLWFAGVDLDGSMDTLGYWATAIYNGGEAANKDIDAHLLAAGANLAISDAFGVHGEVIYASGEEAPAVGDQNGFQQCPGSSYYWSEIMGLGTFDAQASINAPADDISNLIAVNVGLTYQATDKLSFGADLWYASLAEDDAAGESELGTEIDLKAKYILVEGVTLDVIAAYLIAGDVTTSSSAQDANPAEIGTQISVSF